MANISPATAQTASRDPSILIASLLFSGLFSRFVAAVAGKVKKPVLRIFAAVDVCVWGLVIWDMQISHPWSLPAQLISDQRETRALERGPYFFNLVCVLAGGRVWFAQRERIQSYGQNRLQGAESVGTDEEGLHNMRPHAGAGTYWQLIFVPGQHTRVGAEAGRRRLIYYIHRHRLVAHVLEVEVQSSRDQYRYISMKVHRLASGMCSSLSRLYKVDLLLPVEPLRFRRGMRRQGRVSVRINEAKNCTFFRRIHRISARKNVSRLQRAVRHPWR